MPGWKWLERTWDEEGDAAVKRKGRDDMTDQNDLTPEEKMSFQRLSREAAPSPFLEERVVSSLRDAGVLRSEAVDEPEVALGSRRRAWFRPWMVAASMAASLVLFASGVVLGDWMGSQTTTHAFMQVREQDAAQLALRIQEAGSAYVSALTALGQIQDGWTAEGSPGGEASLAGTNLQQGREVALGAFYGAANELARLSPDDADVLRVVQILEDRRARDEGWGGDDRNVVWF